MTTDSTAPTPISPLTAVTPVTLHLTALELGALAALAGLGIAGMAGDRDGVLKYQSLLARDGMDTASMGAFQAVLNAMEAA